MRLMSLWAMARAVPATIDAAASTATTGAQSSMAEMKGTASRRARAAKPPTFAAAAR